MASLAIVKTCSSSSRSRCTRSVAAGVPAVLCDGVGDPGVTAIEESHAASTSRQPPTARPFTIAAYHVPALAAPQWLLVDGSSAIFRAFYGVPQTFRTDDGFLVNAIRGTLD